MPTDDDLENCPHVVLTSDELEWDPHTVQMDGHRPYGDNALATVNAVKTENNKHRRTPMESESDLCLGSISSIFVADTMYERLVSSVRVSGKANNKQNTEVVNNRYDS